MTQESQYWVLEEVTQEESEGKLTPSISSSRVVSSTPEDSVFSICVCVCVLLLPGCHPVSSRVLSMLLLEA